MLKIKLFRTGKKNQPTYRIVIAKDKSKRGGKYVDLIGNYNPSVTPHQVSIDKKKLNYWLSKGAQPTNTVKRLIKKHG